MMYQVMLGRIISSKFILVDDFFNRFLFTEKQLLVSIASLFIHSLKK